MMSNKENTIMNMHNSKTNGSIYMECGCQYLGGVWRPEFRYAVLVIPCSSCGGEL